MAPVNMDSEKEQLILPIESNQHPSVDPYTNYMEAAGHTMWHEVWS